MLYIALSIIIDHARLKSDNDGFSEEFNSHLRVLKAKSDNIGFRRNHSLIDGHSYRRKAASQKTKPRKAYQIRVNYPVSLPFQRSSTPSQQHHERELLNLR